MSRAEKAPKPYKKISNKNIAMEEMDIVLPSMPPKVEQKLNPSLQAAMYRFIQFQNPLLSEAFARAEYVRLNDARTMTEAIQNNNLDVTAYEQMLLAITLTEGIASWGVQEIQGRINAKSKQTIYNSPATHEDYVLNQIKRFSILEESRNTLQRIPTLAVELFPTNSKSVYEFFGMHAVFSVTKSIIGHATVDDMLQPLLETHSVDQALQLLIKNPPEKLEELFDPVAQVERLSKI